MVEKPNMCFRARQAPQSSSQPSSYFTDMVVVAQGWSEKQGMRIIEYCCWGLSILKLSFIGETAHLRIPRMLNVSPTVNDPCPLHKEVQSCDVLCLTVGSVQGQAGQGFEQPDLVWDRVIEWFGLEGTFRGHLVQPSCIKQGHLQPDRVAQIPLQPDLECFQGWGIYHVSGQTGPVCHHHHHKEFLPYIQSKSTLF